MNGFFKKLFSLDTYDHPIAFISFTVLAVCGLVYYLNRGAAKLNIPGPSALLNQ